MVEGHFNKLLAAFERMGALFILLVVVVGIGWLADRVGGEAVRTMDRIAQAIEDQTRLNYAIYASKHRERPMPYGPPSDWSLPELK